MAEKISRTVLVTGATGHQGSAVCRTLCFRGHKVHAFTRHPTSDEAKRVQALGAVLVEGDFEDRESLAKAMKGCDAVFAMGTPYEKGVEAEIREDENILDVAGDVGVRHVLFSSVASADRNTGIAHFDSKHIIEKELEKSGLPYTIVAPVYFIENLWSDRELPMGFFSWGIPRDHPLQQVALSDLAEVCAEILELRDPYLGKRIEVASDEVTGDDAATHLSAAAGRQFSYKQVSPHEKGAALGEDYVKMLSWFIEEGYSVDIARLHEEFPSVHWHTFESWAHEQDWRYLDRAAEALKGMEAGAPSR